MADVLIHLQETYSQLMPLKILNRKDISKKTTYNPRDSIATIFSSVEEIFEFANITGTAHTQHQSVNIAYVITHRTGYFRLDICKRNHMSTVQKLGSNSFFGRRITNYGRQRISPYKTR